MPSIICPFCQHQNSSGTRFCSECGCSIHLTICPNPQCGKISEVGAAKCVHCGHVFPEISDVPAGTENAAGLEVNPKYDGDSTTPVKEKPRTSALPLIMVAIVAGGLPLLWANRALLPTPDTWKRSTADSSKPNSILPPKITLPSPSTTPALPPPTTPTDSAAQPAAKIDSSSAVMTAKTKATTGDTPKKVTKTPRVKSAEKPRPCTEATVALGLCDPKRTTK
jgi:hypothetical protein